MKQFLEDQELKNLTVPTVTLSQHQARLRHALVSRARHKADAESPTLQGVIHFMKKKTILTSAGIAGVLAIAVLSFSAVGPAQNVSALQLAQNSSKALQSTITEADAATMSPEALAYKKYSPQFSGWLEEAQYAPDLQVRTYQQILASYPGAEQSDTTESLRIIDNPMDGETPNVHKLQYLEFTLVEGDAEYKIVVGVNEHNVPEAALMHIITPGTARG
jgi:hypothetical protein